MSCALNDITKLSVSPPELIIDILSHSKMSLWPSFTIVKAVYCDIMAGEKSGRGRQDQSFTEREDSRVSFRYFVEIEK